MHTPSALRALTRRVPARWQERVRRIRPQYVLIWNPIIECFAVLQPSHTGLRLEFNGYGYPGWMYLISCTDKDGYPKPLDESFLADLRNRSRYGHETSRVQLDLKFREMMKQKTDDATASRQKTADDTWDEARDDVRRLLTDRKVIPVGTRRAS